jgi:hypothetical protein
MNMPIPSNVTTLGLLEKRIEGDDCLMMLAQHRFQQTVMGAEMPAGTPEQLERLLTFRPSEDSPVVVHLPRAFNLANDTSRTQILEFASRFAGLISGMVIHDHPAMATQQANYIEAAWNLDDQLEKINRCPVLFVEYAAGLEPATFVEFFASIPDLDRIGACIDIGHIGIRQARAAYALSHRGEDVCSLKSQAARLPQLIPDIEIAVQTGAAAVLETVEAIVALKKPVHFHLHDGHPLSTGSPFGVSDHLGFQAEIPLAFEYHGCRKLSPMFGPEGMAKVVSRALQSSATRRISFTLEIHPTFERLPLGEALSLFGHWTDKTNAEQMNHWLDLLSRNHELLKQAIKAASLDQETAVL